MAEKPKNDLPKVPPFVIERKAAPVNQEPPRKPAPARNNNRNFSSNNHRYPSERGMLSVMILLFSSASLSISMAGGAWVGFGILQEGIAEQTGLVAKIIATGLAYLVGWVAGIFGIRILGNLILPIVVQVYSWFTVVGVCVLQIEIISKLFKQEYSPEKFVLYVTMFSAGLLALIGLHLLMENQSLRIFSFPMLAICLAHLFVIVFHYVFFPSDNVKYEYLWGDTIFFLFTGVVSTLMLAHLGILDGLRDSIDHYFRKKTDHLVPPH
jgi:hypothetical protein